MPKRVAIAGNSPTWRRGVASILSDAGFTAVECPSLADWKPGRDGAAVILDVGDGAGLVELSAFSEEHPHIPVVAVLEDLTVAGFAAAVRAGAHGAVGEDEVTDSFVQVLEAALLGRAAVPQLLIRSMAARIPAAPDPGAWISEKEAGWLRDLAAGLTVASLADDTGYSEREMFRVLNELYLRIGVRNRTEAIIWATRHGVLDDEAGG